MKPIEFLIKIPFIEYTIMIKTYKYKLYKGKKYKHLNNELAMCWEIYNHCLRVIKTHSKIYKKNPTKHDLQKHLTKIMKTDKYHWSLLGYSQAIQEITDRIYLSYAAFFKWMKGGRKGAKKSPPKFKSFFKYKSFTLKQTGWKLDQENSKIRIGEHVYKYHNSRRIQGTPKTITIKRDPVGDWFITITCDLGNEFIPEKPIAATGKTEGLDFGFKSFLTTSENEQYLVSEFLKRDLKLLQVLNRSLSRKEFRSSNWKKAKKLLAKQHRRIEWQRDDEQFKLARKLLEQFDFIFIEDLDLDAMKKEFGRKVSDLAFSKFILFLEFKAMENGKFVGKVGRFYASTKTCSSCLYKKEFMPLRERTFKCDNCGFKCGRDHNAAINIKREGASSLWLGIVSLNLGLAAPVKA